MWSETFRLTKFSLDLGLAALVLVLVLWAVACQCQHRFIQRINAKSLMFSMH